MIRAALALLAALVGAPAFALSCRPYSPVDAFIEAQAAPEPHVVVTGTLDFDKRRMPKVDWDRQDETPPSTRLPARLVGKMLGASGFKTPFAQDITMDVLCFGPWCGAVGSGQTHLSFLRRDGDGYVLTISPCDSRAFAAPSAKVLRQMRTCFNGGTCTSHAR